MEAEKSVQSDQTEQDSLNKQQTTITITYKRANPTSTSGAGPPNGTSHPPQTYHYTMPPNFASHHPHFHSNMPPGGGGATHPMHQPLSASGHSPPPAFCKDERSQRQYIKLKKKQLDKQQKSVDSIGGRKELVNGIKRVKDKGMNSVGTSEDGEESSSLQDDDDSAHITDILSSVEAPKVSELTSRSALLQWAAPRRLSEASSNDSHELDIPENDLRYEVLLSDKSKEMKYKSIYSGTSLSCRIEDLRPGLEYSVCLQVHFDELQGSASDPLKFTTPACEPDAPAPPKLISRTKSTLQLRWNATTANGSPILHYILEYDEGKGGDFVELYKSRGNQHSLQKLTAATPYKFRLSAVNDIGRSQYSDVVVYETSENAPTQPSPPQLDRADIQALHLSWARRPMDDQFILAMDTSDYGYMPVYNGQETKHSAVSLKQFTNYKFRLRTKNDGGLSEWSEEVIFQTLPDRPAKPSNPVVKGKIHARSFRLKWDPPIDTGGPPVTKYILEMSSSGGYVTCYGGADPEANCDKLTPGTTYQLRVCCESAGGRSNYSDLCTVTTEAICPGRCAPIRLAGKPRATGLTLRISEPDYDGGAPVLEYEVEMTAPDQSKTLVHKSKDTECNVEGLLPGSRYVFTARALNRVGAGEWAEEASLMSGAAPPEACAQPTATCRSSTHVFVQWSAPATNGASISEYRLEMGSNGTADDQFTLIYQGESTSYDAKNLTPFTTYYFRVQAANSAGYGLYSPIAATITPAAPPAQIQNIRHTSTPTSIALSWLEPSSNGTPISEYIIEVADQVIHTEEPITKYVIEDLQPETSYKIKLRAVNSEGMGPQSSTLRVATAKLPPAPPKLECIGVGHNCLKLKWGEGKNPEYTTFIIEMESPRAYDYQTVFKGTAFTYKVNKLQEATTYKFRICACNDAGEGDYSDDYEFMTNLAPPAAIKPPKIIDVDQNSCSVEWMPSRNANPDPIEYCVQLSRLKDQQYKEVYKGPDTRCTLERLDAGCEYAVRICPIRKTQDADLAGPFTPFAKFSTTAVETISTQRIVAHTSGTPTHHRHKASAKSQLPALWQRYKEPLSILKYPIIVGILVVFILFLCVLFFT
ncbi:fibronectin type-III domain-containing protein 3A-like isoform X4 [Atheta coriaria]|uniref:fibronectin type-III domain-containing protein 3A-like isoform X4 n=1 Tax=Dalotia coriaria TaxID=877792 RepID=UPI0031F3EAEF